MEHWEANKQEVDRKNGLTKVTFKDNQDSCNGNQGEQEKRALIYIIKNFYEPRDYARLFTFFQILWQPCKIGNILVGKYLNKELNPSEFKTMLFAWEERISMKLSQHGIFEDYKVIHDFSESSQ